MIMSGAGSATVEGGDEGRFPFIVPYMRSYNDQFGNAIGKRSAHQLFVDKQIPIESAGDPVVASRDDECRYAVDCLSGC